LIYLGVIFQYFNLKLERFGMSNERIENIQANMKNLFEQFYRKMKSESLRDIYREVYGSDYPEEADPDGFVSNSDLQNIIDHLNVSSGDIIIDLGCGRGGPGLWISRKTGATYTGIDLSENAIYRASERIKDFRIEGNVKFECGDISSLNFPDNSFNGAISIDTLSFMPDLPKTFLEISRVLRSKSNLVFITWEKKKVAKIKDYQHYLLNAGFNIKVYEEVKDWERRQREVYEKILESKKVLIKDMGMDGAFAWILDAKSFLPGLKDSRRIFVVATKK
jgi:ubiquinone/menaquinone biosynthesis C-methylase UbiE